MHQGFLPGVFREIQRCCSLRTSFALTLKSTPRSERLDAQPLGRRSGLLPRHPTLLGQRPDDGLSPTRLLPLPVFRLLPARGSLLHLNSGANRTTFAPEFKCKFRDLVAKYFCI